MSKPKASNVLSVLPERLLSDLFEDASAHTKGMAKYYFAPAMLAMAAIGSGRAW